MRLVLDTEACRSQEERHVRAAERFEARAREERRRAALWTARRERAEAGDPVHLELKETT